MIKAEGELQPYWMSMMRTWLKSLDVSLEKEITEGRIDPLTAKTAKKNGTKPAPEAIIASHLVCSYGTTFNCSGRVSLKFQNLKNIVVFSLDPSKWWITTTSSTLKDFTII